MKKVSALLFCFTILLVGCKRQSQHGQNHIKKETHSSPKMSIVYTDYGAAAYSKKFNQRYLQIVKKIGLKSVDILYTCQVEDEKDPDIKCNTQDSPRRSVLEKLIKDLKRKGLYVSLRAYVDLKNQKWRALWRPEPLEKGFANLKSFLIEMATMAKDLKIDQLYLGSEYELLTHKGNHKYWSSIIDEVRKVYKGRLLYAANGNPNNREIKEYQWVPFWPELDAIGINHYPEYKGELNYNLLLEHHTKVLSELKSFTQFFNKPLVISEVGFPLANTGALTPYKWEYSKDSKGDQSLQLMNMRAFFKGARKNQIYEYYLWRYLPKERDIHPLGYILDNKATIEMLRELNEM